MALGVNDCQVFGQEALCKGVGCNFVAKLHSVQHWFGVVGILSRVQGCSRIKLILMSNGVLVG